MGDSEGPCRKPTSGFTRSVRQIPCLKTNPDDRISRRYAAGTMSEKPRRRMCAAPMQRAGRAGHHSSASSEVAYAATKADDGSVGSLPRSATATPPAISSACAWTLQCAARVAVARARGRCGMEARICATRDNDANGADQGAKLLTEPSTLAL